MSDNERPKSLDAVSELNRRFDEKHIRLKQARLIPNYFKRRSMVIRTASELMELSSQIISSTGTEHLLLTYLIPPSFRKKIGQHSLTIQDDEEDNEWKKTVPFFQLLEPYKTIDPELLAMADKVKAPTLEQVFEQVPPEAKVAFIWNIWYRYLGNRNKMTTILLKEDVITVGQKQAETGNI